MATTMACWFGATYGDCDGTVTVPDPTRPHFLVCTSCGRGTSYLSWGMPSPKAQKEASK